MAAPSSLASVLSKDIPFGADWLQNLKTATAALQNYQLLTKDEGWMCFAK